MPLMRLAPALIALSCLLAGCGGGGSGTSSTGSISPANQSTTYSGQFYNSSNVALGTATVVVTGSNIQATLIPTGPYSTFLLTGTVQNGIFMSSGTIPTKIGNESVSGKTLTITGISDNVNNQGILSVAATQS
jgi:hypothetical protein